VFIYHLFHDILSAIRQHRLPEKLYIKGHTTVYILYYVTCRRQQNTICRHMLLFKTLICYFLKTSADAFEVSYKDALYRSTYLVIQ